MSNFQSGHKPWGELEELCAFVEFSVGLLKKWGDLGGSSSTDNLLLE